MQQETWLNTIASKHPAIDATYLESVLALCEDATAGTAAADIMLPLCNDTHAIATALLYPAALSDTTLRDKLNTPAHTAVHTLLSGVMHIDTVLNQKGHSDSPTQVNRMRQLILALIGDARIVLVKLATEIVTLASYQNASDDARQTEAHLAMDVYAPLANRLGIDTFKSQLEDWAFRTLQPDAYSSIQKDLAMREDDRARYVKDMIDRLQTLVSHTHITDTTIAGRAKHIYSIHKKLERKHITMAQLYDTIALRICVPSVADCYAMLGLVHTHWQHIPTEFDDYIAKPKPNGYQSLHTAVVGPKDRHVEIQIRTHTMHQTAELGIAAHWAYKEGGQHAPEQSQMMKWLEGVFAWQEEVTQHNLNTIRAITQTRVYIFTPQGDIVDMPAGATVLDFAYHVHTSLGHRCTGARVNQHWVPLTHVLQNGDSVDIQACKHEQPKRDWLDSKQGYLATKRARDKVQNWFKKAAFDEHYKAGIEPWEKTIKPYAPDKAAIAACTQHFNMHHEHDLIAAIGAHAVSAKQVAHYFRDQQTIQDTPDNKHTTTHTQRSAASRKTQHAAVDGTTGLLTALAGCCKPIPGDDIIGYISKGRGVIIHQTRCPNMKRLSTHHPNRSLDIAWQTTQGEQYPVDLTLISTTDTAVVRDISQTISQSGHHLVSIRSHFDKHRMVTRTEICIEVKQTADLPPILQQLGEHPGILKVERKS